MRTYNKEKPGTVIYTDSENYDYIRAIATDKGWTMKRAIADVIDLHRKVRGLA